uniref:Capsid Decoration Protein n=1 Tax=Ribes TaxID=3801 RepID=UPI0023BB1BD2|nr:Chain A, Capsid Decoration Protein [Ribes]8CJZ_B Chain B, Capsid Decoration Protein [Ribes]8CJZ_C Chain C, Capsid Decoration Protein [Ribes]8CJZ_D Chain D, Capsid Decoration Protein [Ribes]8CJZ_E Chain E, Capsid Decoration Protein [Ribes]8CJZ_F Chain F, Capsid Decoration Protein [Ribes]8CJZ_c Chain c, Capsid Decoration Protein [Ribes]
MIMDKENTFSYKQAITGTAVSTNVIDLGVSRDIGKGVPVPIIIQVVEDFADATSLTATLQTSETENFSSATTLATSGAVPVADLTAGKQLAVQYMPLGTQRYLRVNYTVSGTATAGAVTAGVVMSHQQND